MEAVETLVAAGADPNAVNHRTGYTPPHYASLPDGPPYVECLEALVRLGGKVTRPCRAGWRPMDFQVEQGDERAAALKDALARAALNEDEAAIKAEAEERLAAFSFESPRIMMWDAVVYNDPATLKAALAAGADQNQPLSAEEYEKWHYRAVVNGLLMNLSEFSDCKLYVLFESLGKPEVLKVLLEAGTRLVNHYDYFDAPLLHHVINPMIVMDNKVETLVCLLEAGSEVDMRDAGNHGRTALQYVCAEKFDGAYIEALLKYGASVHAVDNYGDTALHCAGFFDEGYKIWKRDYLDGQSARSRRAA